MIIILFVDLYLKDDENNICFVTHDYFSHFKFILQSQDVNYLEIHVFYHIVKPPYELKFFFFI